MIAALVIIAVLQVATLAAVGVIYRRNRLTLATLNAAIRKSHDDTWQLLSGISEQLQKKPEVSVNDYVELADAYIDAMRRLVLSGHKFEEVDAPVKGATAT